MCGIAGMVLTQADPQSLRTLEAMLDGLRHRGPDATGTTVEGQGRVWLGHRRLSVVELGEAGLQPMASACGRYVIVFNGEIYNFRRLREELRRSGHTPPWRGESDTEVLLEAVARWGLQAALERAIGMFALALWDRREGQLWLARDRMGKKPLYYGMCGQDLVFASELRAFRHHPKFPCQIEPKALTLLMQLGYVPSPLSIIAGVFKLSPGHLFCPDLPGGEQAYWSHASFAGRSRRLDAGQAKRELLTLLDDAVGLRLIADVPLGVFLSGGIDSSLVAALAQRQSSRPIRTFSVSLGGHPLDESRQAAAVAAHLGTRHTEVFVGPEAALPLISRLGSVYDEPFCDSSQIPTFLLSQAARQDVTVILSGDGGDEPFCGYDRYSLCCRQWAWASRLPPGLGSLLAAALEALPAGIWPRPALADRGHGLAELLRCRSLLDNYYRLAGFWNRPQVALRNPVFSREFAERLSGSPQSDGIEKLMYFDLQTLLPDGILTKVDRASMAVSLEVRCPLLDHRVVEYAWSLPLSLKCANGQPKWILKSLLFDLVPRALLDRPKKGFSIPLAEWLRGPLRPWAEQLLDPVAMGPLDYFDGETIARTWSEFVNQGRGWHNRLWAILMFLQWWAEFHSQ